MIYSTKEKAEPGTYKCSKCNYVRKYNENEIITHCPICNEIMWEKLI
jgi:rubrerythrin